MNVLEKNIVTLISKESVKNPKLIYRIHHSPVQSITKINNLITKVCLGVTYHHFQISTSKHVPKLRYCRPIIQNLKPQFIFVNCDPSLTYLVQTSK